MYAIRRATKGYGFFCGMVYHGECGWHCGIQHNADVSDIEIVKYSTLVQAEQQVKFMEDMFHEKDLVVITISN